MDIQGINNANVSAALEIKSLKMAQGQQEQEGQAALELLEAAGTTGPSGNPNLGSIVDTYA